MNMGPGARGALPLGKGAGRVSRDWHGQTGTWQRGTRQADRGRARTGADRGPGQGRLQSHLSGRSWAGLSCGRVASGTRRNPAAGGATARSTADVRRGGGYECSPAAPCWAWRTSSFATLSVKFCDVSNAIENGAWRQRPADGVAKAVAGWAPPGRDQFVFTVVPPNPPVVRLVGRAVWRGGRGPEESSPPATPAALGLGRLATFIDRAGPVRATSFPAGRSKTDSRPMAYADRRRAPRWAREKLAARLAQGSENGEEKVSAGTVFNRCVGRDAHHRGAHNGHRGRTASSRPPTG